jgi:hypothetical protein
MNAGQKIGSGVWRADGEGKAKKRVRFYKTFGPTWKSTGNPCGTGIKYA